MWDILEEDSFGNIKRNDMETWDYFERWPYLHLVGFVGDRPFQKGDQLWRNRHSHNIYKAFKTVYEVGSGEKVEEPMLTMFDRGSILRPSGKNPDWKIESFPHFDINPWWWTKTKHIPEAQWRGYNSYDAYYQKWLGEGNFIPKVRNFTKLQGVLGLSNTNK